MRTKSLWATLALVVVMLISSVLPTFAQAPAPVVPADFPYETKVYEGKTLLAGFDPLEYGGDDSNCTRSELMLTQWGEVASSQAEACKVVLEWSVKVGAQTIFAGVYALEPGEWFYTPKRVAGDFSDPRFVGTLHYLPRGWNAHQYAVNIATARDTRDTTLSVVGLSPTDEWVVSLAKKIQPEGATGQPTEEGTCTVTSSKPRVNVRNGPGTNFGIVRSVRTGTEIVYFGETVNGWKIIREKQFMLGALCVATEQADG